MGDVRQFFSELSQPEKIAFFGLCTMALACFLPWKETAKEGDVLGVLSTGIVVLVASVLGLAALATRVRRNTSLGHLLLWGTQLISIGVSLVWSLLYVGLSWDSTLTHAPVGNYDMWVSKPSFGVILSVFACLIAGLGTLLGLKEPK